MTNKIALVLPTYKANIAHLNQALDCVDLFDEAILHVNDEDTAKQIYPRCDVKIVYQPKRCLVTEALNSIIEMTTANYILPFTDDDIFYRDNLKHVLDYVRNYGSENLDVLHYPIKNGHAQAWKVWGNNPVITFDELLKENLIPFSCIYNKKIWQKVQGYKDVPYSDWYFWLECAKAGCKFEYMDTVVYAHRQGHKVTLSMQESKPYTHKAIQQMFKNKLGVQ